MDCSAKELLEVVGREGGRPAENRDPACLPPPHQYWFWAGTQMPDNSLHAKVYENLVAWGCEDSWTNSLGRSEASLLPGLGALTGE